MAVTEQYVTLEDLAEFLRVDESDLAPGAQLALDAAQAAVRRYLDQDITLVIDDVEVHDGRGKGRIRLRQRPVREVTEVVVDGVPLDGDLWAVRNHMVELVDYYDAFPWGRGNVVITYSHGWDTELSYEYEIDEMVPADIRWATLSASRRTYLDFGEDEGTGAVQSETIGAYSYQTASELRQAAAAAGTDLYPPELAILDRYRVQLVP